MITEHGSPAGAGAKLSLRTQVATTTRQVTAETVVDEAGRFRVVLPSPEWRWHTLAAVRLVDVAGGIAFDAPVMLQPELLLRVHRRTLLHGVVLAQNGAPVAAAAVSLWLQNSAAPWIQDLTTTSPTDEAGRFQIVKYLPSRTTSDRYLAEVRFPGAMARTYVTHAKLTSTEGATIRLDTDRLTVAVRDLEQRAVVGAKVRCSSAGWGPQNRERLSGTTDEAGAAEFVLPAGHAAQVAVAMEGFALWLGDTAPGQTRLTATLRPLSPRPIRISGIVLTPDGNACSGSHLSVWPATEYLEVGAVQMQHATSDERGNFELSVDPSAFPCWIACNHSRWGLADDRRVTAAADTHLEIRHRARRDVRLQLDALMPLALHPASDGPILVFVRCLPGGETQTYALSDVPLTLRDLPIGRCELSVLCGGGAAAGRAEVELVAGDGYQQVRVGMQPTTPIRGTVVQNGAGVDGLEVRLVDPGHGQPANASLAPWSSCMTRLGGAFELNAFDLRDRALVEVLHQGRLLHRTEVSAGTAVTIVLP